MAERNRPCDCAYKQQQSRIDGDLQRLAGDVDENSKNIGRLEVAVATLVVKSGIWGALAGLVAAVGAVLLAIARK